MGNAEIGSEISTEVNFLWPNPPLLIALHSPYILLETGLRLCHRAKSRTLARSQLSSSFSAVGFAEEQSRNAGIFTHFAGNRGTNFSAVKIAGGEGGIRTLGTGVSPYNGLANRRIRPLCHLSSPVDVHQFITEKWPHFVSVQFRSLHFGSVPLTAEISLDGQNRAQRKYRNWIGETSELKSAETIN